MTPTVSIVMPFRDAAAHLEEAVASTLAQTFNDWELLLVDDGSTDRSPAIASAAARADPRIQVHRRPPGVPGNAAAARNVGIAHACGAFVAFLDADDAYEPERLASHLRAFERHPGVEVVYGPTRWWHPGAEHLDAVEDVRAVAGRVHRPPELLTRVLLLQRGQVPCTCSVTIRRAALQRVGGFEEAFELYEDQTLWVKLLLRCRAYVTDEVGARYRQHDASTTARSIAAGRYDRMRPHEAREPFLAWVGEHARADGPVEPSVERALRLALAPYPGQEAALTPGDRVARTAWRSADRLRTLPRRARRKVRKLTGARREP
ncbi:MAG TPA: glycosyltransferase family A protein [Aquihabitans sp.]|jgi:glycosyltransferase involved in cell wall biosynthesis|nr:glycosyltransferase family A protein [Aquihabitans sp.]